MIFKVVHSTVYQYNKDASESCGELRLCPQTDHHQKVSQRTLSISPQVKVYQYTDYFGNIVEFFFVPFGHKKLQIQSTAVVETSKTPDYRSLLEPTLGEVRQILGAGRSRKFFDFLQPTPLVPLGKVLLPLRKKFFQSQKTYRETLFELNAWIYKHFTYKPGVTDTTTPLEKIIKKREGVCQDFAHLMLSILRTGGIPARYVSGYIEPFDPNQPTGTELTGAAASHAWVEVLLPGETWMGLDPTNNQIAGERHVRVAVGRDFNDVSPLRGTYKGAQDQKLGVMVSLKRK